MFFSKTFILLQIFLQASLLGVSQADHSPLAKICHDKSEDVCVGVYISSQWLLASSLCKHIQYKDAKAIMGSLQRDCITGETRNILQIYELNQVQNIYLLKLVEPFETAVASSFLENNFGQGSCETYCLQGTNGTCGKKIDPVPTIIIPCKDEGSFKDKICLKTENNAEISNLDGSPLLCNGTMNGYVSLTSTKNLLTLANLSKFYDEINEIIRSDAKISSSTPISNDTIEKTPAKNSFLRNFASEQGTNVSQNHNINERIRLLLPQKKVASPKQKVFADLLKKTKETIKDSVPKIKGAGRRVSQEIINSLSKIMSSAERKIANIQGTRKKKTKRSKIATLNDEEDESEVQKPRKKKKAKKEETKGEKTKGEKAKEEKIQEMNCEKR